MSGKPTVGIIGSGQIILKEHFQLAYDIGKLLAQRGAIVVCGGLGGVMEAAAKGAHENNGLTIGILPSNARSDANPFIDIAVPTGLGRARNALVVNTADVLIAFPGAFGTLGELAMALDAGKSVVFLPGAWDLRKAGNLGGVRFLEAFDANQAVGLALGEIGRKTNT